MSVNWQNFSIGEYQKIKASQASGLDALALATNKTVDELEELTTNQLIKLINEFEFINHEPEGQFVRKWEGYTLLAFTKKGGASAMIDFMAILEQNEYVKNLHVIMAIISLNGKEEDFEAKCKKFQDEMPVTIAVGIADFFFQNFRVCKKTIPFYLEQVRTGKVNPTKLMEKIRLAAEAEDLS